jgi:hypothetical protein
LSSAIEIREAAARRQLAGDVPASRLAGLRPLLTIIVFLVGIGAGATAFLGWNVALPRHEFASAPLTQEPRAAAIIADALTRDDAHALSDVASADRLEELAGALEPLVDVTEIRFVQAVEQYGDTLSAYVVRGHDSSGMKWAVGVVFRVRADQLVGVN